jgi:hypothetical protein
MIWAIGLINSITQLCYTERCYSIQLIFSDEEAATLGFDLLEHIHFVCIQNLCLNINV